MPLSPSVRTGSLSLSLHGAHNLKPTKPTNQSINQSTNQSINQSILQPIALIRLPYCDRVYSTQCGNGTSPVWKDEFDLAISYDQSINQSINQSTNQYQSMKQTVKQSLNDYTVYDIDEEFDDININQSTNQSIDQAINQSIDDIVIEVIDNVQDRNVIGRTKLSINQIAVNNQSTNQSINPSTNPSTDQSINQPIRLSLPLDNNAGVIELSASWTDKSTNQPISHSTNQSINQSVPQSTNQSINQSTNQSTNQPTKQSPGFEKRGRFLVSEVSYQSISDQSTDQSTNQSSSDEFDEISGTASTDSENTNQSINQSPDTKQLKPQTLLDRRSSSNESLNQSINQSINQSYSFPVFEDTYTSHQNRHVASFLPTKQSTNQPFYHTTGRHGLLYDDSTTFDDRNFIHKTIQSINQSINQSHQKSNQKSNKQLISPSINPSINSSINQYVHPSICEIRVWSRDFIHGIQVTYAFTSTNQSTHQSFTSHFPGPSHVGRVHTTENVLKLHHHDGEYVIGIEGEYREWIDVLTVVTNRRSHTFGGNLENRVKKWKPAGSPKLPTKFRCDVPKGHRVVAITGAYGVHMHNIGIAHAPITEGDLKQKSKGILNTLKKKFSNTKLNTLDY